MSTLNKSTTITQRYTIRKKDVIAKEKVLQKNLNDASNNNFKIQFISVAIDKKLYFCTTIHVTLLNQIMYLIEKQIM